MLENILNREKYPCHITETEGEQLKKIFEEKVNKKFLNKFYFYERDGYKYILLEELLFEENNPFLDINKIIGKNFLLNREKR